MSTLQNKVIISLVSLSLLGCASDFYYENGKKVEVVELKNQELKQKQNSEAMLKFYKTAKGHKIGVKDDILVECKEKVDCREVLSKYETVSVKSLTKSIFLVKISKDKNVFKFSQKLYEDADVKIAHPNFRKEKRRR